MSANPSIPKSKDIPISTILELIEERLTDIEFTLEYAKADDEADLCLKDALKKLQDAKKFILGLK